MKKIFLIIFLISLIIFLISLPLTLIIGNILQDNGKALGGAAISGYEENGKYFIMTYTKEFEEVSRHLWMKNYVLWVSTLVLGLIFMISMAVSVTLYLIVPALSKM